MEEELLIYEAFPFQASDSSAADQRLKLRFKKFDHGLILKERARGRQRRKGDEEEEEDLSHLDKILRLRCFNDISGYSGVKKERKIQSETRMTASVRKQDPNT